MNTKKVVILVSCGKRKSNFPCTAKEMYNSSRFMTLIDFAEKSNYEWFIISSKYGLLSPNQIIEPYDQNLADLEQEKRVAWAKRIASTLKIFSKETVFVILADGIYSTTLSSELAKSDYRCICPIQTMTNDEIIELMTKAVNQKERIKKLYDSIFTLSDSIGGIRLIKECNGKMYWPQMGVYFVMDYSETSIFSSYCPKIVRIGTHAVSANSKSTLWGRIKTHKGTNDGRGSHRSSIFRLHVGNSIKNRNKICCDSWGIGQNASRYTRDNETYLEQLVSEYIGNLGILYLDIDDIPSAQSMRAYIEKNTISLLSTINNSFEYSTTQWLGNYSSKNEIIRSNLWNINHIGAHLDSSFFEKIDPYFELTICKYMENRK